MRRLIGAVIYFESPKAGKTGKFTLVRILCVAENISLPP
jgi:hypothetical protein